VQRSASGIAIAATQTKPRPLHGRSSRLFMDTAYAQRNVWVLGEHDPMKAVLDRVNDALNVSIEMIMSDALAPLIAGRGRLVSLKAIWSQSRTKGVCKSATCHQPAL